MDWSPKNVPYTISMGFWALSPCWYSCWTPYSQHDFTKVLALGGSRQSPNPRNAAEWHDNPLAVRVDAGDERLQPTSLGDLEVGHVDSRFPKDFLPRNHAGSLHYGARLHVHPHGWLSKIWSLSGSLV